MIRLFTNQNHSVAVQNGETVFISKCLIIMYQVHVKSQLNKGIIIIIVIMWC